jgi:hypothetical protein
VSTEHKRFNYNYSFTPMVNFEFFSFHFGATCAYWVGHLQEGGASVHFFANCIFLDLLST